jgi:hypothetical protein
MLRWAIAAIGNLGFFPRTIGPRGPVEDRDDMVSRRTIAIQVGRTEFTERPGQTDTEAAVARMGDGKEQVCVILGEIRRADGVAWFNKFLERSELPEVERRQAHGVLTALTATPDSADGTGGSSSPGAGRGWNRLRV